MDRLVLIIISLITISIIILVLIYSTYGVLNSTSAPTGSNPVEGSVEASITMSSTLQGEYYTATSIVEMSLDQVFDMASRYLRGDPVDAEKLVNAIKAFAGKYGSPITYGSQALFIYIGNAGSVSVPGDWNGWSTDADKMIRIGGDLWILLKEFPIDARLDYKLYVDGRWILDPLNNRTVLGGFGPNSELVMPNHVFPPWYGVDKDVLNGSLTTYSIVNNYTGRSHAVAVYTPPSSRQFDYIIYFYDGGDYLNYCYAAKIIDYMVSRNMIPSVAAVFVSVSNPNYRINEYGDQLDETSDFMVKQVVPFIEEKLNITSGIKRVIVGDSLAGLIATYTLAKYPTVFNSALIQSPAYWYNQGKLINQLSLTNLSNHKIYVNYGSFEGSRFIDIIRNTAGVLREKGAVVEVVETSQGHSWGQWREYLGYGLIYLLSP